MFKVLKKDIEKIKIICDKIEISQRKNNLKNSPKLKSTIIEIKNSLKGLKDSFEQAKESINLKIRQWKLSRLRNRKKIEQSQQSLRDLWSPSSSPTYALWESQKDEEEKGRESI